MFVLAGEGTRTLANRPPSTYARDAQGHVGDLDLVPQVPARAPSANAHNLAKRDDTAFSVRGGYL